MSRRVSVKEFINKLKRDMYIEKNEDMKNFVIECFTDDIDLYMPIGHEDGSLFILTIEMWKQGHKPIMINWKRTGQDEVEYFLE